MRPSRPWIIVLAAVPLACTTGPTGGAISGVWRGPEQSAFVCETCQRSVTWTFDVREDRHGDFEGMAVAVTTRTDRAPDTTDLIVLGRQRSDGYLALSLSCPRWEICAAAQIFFGGVRVGADSIELYTVNFGEAPTINLARTSNVFIP